MHVTKTLIAAAIFAAGIGATSQASATVTIPVPLTSAPGLYTAHYGATVSGIFNDIFTFSLPRKGAKGSFTLTSSSIIASSVITGLTGYLDTATNSFSISQFGLSPYTFDFGRLSTSTLAAGAHKIVISGRTGTASVAGTITIAASAVPEPATWAMMIGGIGVAGGAMRRRRARVTMTFGRECRTASS